MKSDYEKLAEEIMNPTEERMKSDYEELAEEIMNPTEEPAGQMVKGKEATVVLRGAMLRRVIRHGIKAGAMGDDVDVTGEINVLSTSEAISVTVTKIAVAGGAEEKALDGEVQEQIDTAEHDLRCGDIIIIAPCNQHGRELVRKHGNVWKVQSGRSNKGDTAPHTWIITSLPAKQAGKFTGSDKKSMAQESLPVAKGPLQWARIMFVSSFVDNFNWKDFHSALKVKNVTIEQLNSVNFDKKKGEEV